MRSIIGTLCLIAVLSTSSAASAITLPDSGSCNSPGVTCLVIEQTNTTPSTLALDVKSGFSGAGGAGNAIRGRLLGTNQSGTAVTGDAGTSRGNGGWFIGGLTPGGTGNGLFATAFVGDGINASTTSSARSAVYAHNDSQGGWGVHGTANGTGMAVYGGNSNSSGWAGYFDGKVFASAGYTSSDARLKKEITALPYGLTDLAVLRPVTFKWKEQVRGDGRHLGFVAQDLQKVFPEIVAQDDKGMLAVNYVGLIPVLVKAVQEQQTIIQRQEARIASIEQRPMVSSTASGAMLFMTIAGLGYMVVQRLRQRKAQ
jgi:hypothetical protein